MDAQDLTGREGWRREEGFVLRSQKSIKWQCCHDQRGSHHSLSLRCNQEVLQWFQTPSHWPQSLLCWFNNYTLLNKPRTNVLIKIEGQGYLCPPKKLEDKDCLWLMELRQVPSIPPQIWSWHWGENLSKDEIKILIHQGWLTQFVLARRDRAKPQSELQTRLA